MREMMIINQFVGGHLATETIEVIILAGGTLEVKGQGRHLPFVHKSRQVPVMGSLILECSDSRDNQIKEDRLKTWRTFKNMEKVATEEIYKLKLLQTLDKEGGNLFLLGLVNLKLDRDFSLFLVALDPGVHLFLVEMDP